MFRAARTRPESGRSGFTVIEILFVVALLSLAAMIAMPGLSSSDSHKLQLAANQVADALVHARDEAVHTEQTLLAEFPTAGTVTLFLIDTTVTPPVKTSIPYDPLTKQPYALDLTSSQLTQGVSFTSQTFQFATVGAKNGVFFGTDGTPRYLDASGDAHRLLNASLALGVGGASANVRLDPINARVWIE